MRIQGLGIDHGWELAGGESSPFGIFMPTFLLTQVGKRGQMERFLLSGLDREIEQCCLHILSIPLSPYETQPDSSSETVPMVVGVSTGR